MQLPFGEWLPDQPDYLNPGATVATNVFSAQTSYKPFKGLVSYSSNNIGQNAKGAGSFRDNTNTVFNFVANKETIFQLDSGTFTERGAGNKLINTSFATCTITITDATNIAPGTTVTLTDNAGNSTTMTATATNPTTNPNEFSIGADNASTADNLAVGAGGVLGINGLSGFSAPNPAANVITVTRAVAGANNLTVTSSDTTRIAVTNFTGGTPLTGSNIDYITFRQFGNFVIASNGVDQPQYFEMGTSTAFKNLSTIATSGSPPIFKVSGVIRDFLVTGNIVGNKNRVAWSGLNDIATWEAGVKSSDTQDLPGSGGEVVHITSGEVGYVFRQNQIVRMDFVGGNVVFRFSVISPNRGAVYGQSVCQDNRQIFFYADDGFFQIDGDQVIPIGAEKVNRFFDQDLNKAFSDRISASVDPFNTLAIWLYPSINNANTTGICDRLLIYNYVTQKWTIAEVKASQIFPQFVVIDTVEKMDLISQNLDNINYALDTPFWESGFLNLGAIDENFKAAIFSGQNLEAELETKESELIKGSRANILGIRPLVDSTANVVIQTRDRLADKVTTSSSVSMNSTGINPVRQSGRYFRANVKIPQGSIWNNAQGIDLEAVPGGNR